MSQPQASTPLLQQPPEKYDHAYMRRLIGLLNRFVTGSSNGSVIQLKGDLGGTITAPVVVGIQGVPVLSGTPTDGQVLQYVAADSKWEASTVASQENESIQVNGVGVSDDYTININQSKPVLVNGA